MSEFDATRSGGVPQPTRAAERLPISGLLALATAGFITILTEALPAGLLREMSADLGVSAALIGQLVTVYAAGSLLSAIPLAIATRGWRRRPLLLTAIAGFIVVNTVTTLSTHYALTLIARFFAGVSAGLVWALLAGHAARMAPAHLQGRAIALAMTGAPLALSLGIPLGTLLGASIGWRYTFGAMTVATLGLLVWVRWQVPDFAGQPAARRTTLRGVLASPGLKPVLAVMFAYVLAHNLLYTYISPFLALAGLEPRVDAVLFVFGAAALASIAIVGALVDAHLRRLTLISVVLFTAGVVLLGLASETRSAVYTGVAVWGLAFGGAATLFQTASARAAGNGADVAQSMIVTVWNLAIAGGGALGGMAIDRYGPIALPWVAAALLIGTLLWIGVAAVRRRRVAVGGKTDGKTDGTAAASCLGTYSEP
ncbi:MFS transporter [Paraburkholderia bryophila]|uniref:Putative MFS family arabinose efflux permease n=1 Tax=Paraburkholderia bryophila TaxID=420952 RepID=A0A7Y9WCH2_9BURK|nr:MFS transporter [Paraburkholderia bryophila]NYH18327.1 putative MFS family arabinose efflux permease [Paraburkholderia bryophila]